MRKFIVSFFALVVAAGFAQKNIEFWYAFSDEARSGWIEDRMSDFNAILKDKGLDYQVIGERKGSYRETLQAAILAARQGTPPHLVQLFEVGSQLAVDSGIFEPVGNIGSFDTGDYIEPVLNYYTIAGAVNSIPFNSSSPILYANTSLMAAAGIESIPSTYGEVIAACEKIMAAGLDAKCIGFNLHSWFFEQWMS
ncbi:MAG: extracellular solute-binding protein, partial [Deinococcales bacterium]